MRLIGKARIFFQNNPESQIISLVNTFSKQFSKLTSRVQRIQFCYAKSSVKRSSFMELESFRLDFPVRANEASSNPTQTRKTKN